MFVVLTSSTVSAAGLMLYERSRGNLPKLKIAPTKESNSTKETLADSIPGFHTFAAISQEINQQAKKIWDWKP